MKDILVLEGGVNVTPYIKSQGYTWTRNTLHSDKTTRVKTGNARVVKITDKLTLSFELGETPVEELRRFNAVLKKQTFRATHYGIDGQKNLEFYCSSFTAGARVITEDQEVWESASFTIIEV
ncbi:hypothetical protein D1159_12670 [Pseudoflavonifractor sp. 524-17]|uniref:hypothetical protein n=1 Tax=Pseudoflavonifractor sp. 524-17 TaxID=2304577 RepID=UPI00137A185A|nr:hypothetical protein [Pseudoflavonifractor sp. 524-17]NCE65407.1 hypothetical protein [Pseudoflavonifractor sp. 524-17]